MCSASIHLPLSGSLALRNCPQFRVLLQWSLLDARNSREIRQALKLIAPMSVIWPTENDCARALSDFTAYHLSHNLGLIDALIAACAVGQQAVLFTFNIKHYRVVPGLNVAEPYRC
jgi:predicted nucleic acid-binding protein